MVLCANLEQSRSTHIMSTYSAYISCPKGIEPQLLDELHHIGGFTLGKQHIGGLSGEADLTTLYRMVLWSRLANRVLLQLSAASIDSKKGLQDWLSAQPWSEHLLPTQSLHIRFFGQLPGIQHSQYGAQFAKDVIVDYFRERFGQRPNVDKDNPDLRFQINIEKQRASLYIDLSGDSLHQRGYRRGITQAPLKENLAAALLLRAGWTDIAAKGGSLIDPLCGSGTFLTEAALIAANIAPGLLRQRFGFHGWKQHEHERWQNLIEEAQTQRRTLSNVILGYDSDKRALGVARQHIEALALNEQAPRVYGKSLQEWKKASHTELKPGLLIANPPYGERLGRDSDLHTLYSTLGDKWQQEYPDWQAALFTSEEALAKSTRLYWHKRHQFFNGSIPCQLYLFDLANTRRREATSDNSTELLSRVNTQGIDIEPFTRRLQKNRQRLKGWLKQNNITCYRLYYADIPEFAVAVDIYHDWALVQEYQAPKTIDEKKSRQRLAAVMQALPESLQLPAEHIVLKQRQQQKGKAQYEKLNEQKQWLTVNEGNARFHVDLHGYLDCGLFLDHRPLRIKLAKLCQGKRFLNLFCYTASATVHAACNGAFNSTSVDMSNTYLDWAQRNFALNNIDQKKHTVVRADIMEWLEQHQERYDVILLDPPTFSNSKRMQDKMDIQHDHIWLIQQAMRCLNKDGVLFFSCNFRKFKLDQSIQNIYKVKDITDWSIPRDFTRPGKIHYCFEIRHK